MSDLFNRDELLLSPGPWTILGVAFFFLLFGPGLIIVTMFRVGFFSDPVLLGRENVQMQKSGMIPVVEIAGQTKKECECVCAPTRPEAIVAQRD